MLELATKIDPSPPYQSFEVSKYLDYFMLKFLDGSPFAQVSELVSRGLTALEQYQSVEMKAFAETKRILHCRGGRWSIPRPLNSGVKTRTKKRTS
jgi:hypothetical protein